MSISAYRLKQFQDSNNIQTGERWKTTSNTALKEVADRLAGSYNRKKASEELYARKISNTKTSISFGNETVNYVSDAQENQLKCMGGSNPEERARQAQRIKAMKAELTTTNFKLGDVMPDYKSTNQEAMEFSASEAFKGTGKVAMNNSLKEAVKKSSISFGNESVAYHTVSHDSMKYHGNTNNFSALKEEVAAMTATLRKHNFSLGDEKVEYQSDYNRGYGTVHTEAYSKSGENKAGMRAIIEDSRSCHFSLGNDKVTYLSNNQAAFQSTESGESAKEVAKGIENAKKMKAELMKTSICIGDDKAYF